MVMLLRCYPYAKNNVTAIQFAIQMFSYRRGCAALYFSSCEVVEEMQEIWMCGFILCCRLCYFASFFFFFWSPLLSKHKEVCTLAVDAIVFYAWLACSCVWHILILRGVRTWKSYAKSDLTGHTETDFQKCDLNWIPSHIRIARNGFAQIRFHEVRCRSDYLNMIGFQSDLHKNRIWVGSLNEAFVSTFFFYYASHCPYRSCFNHV